MYNDENDSSSQDESKASSSTSQLHQKLNIGDGEHFDLLTHPSYLEMLQKLELAEEKITQSSDKLLRLQAETENALRRSERDVANAHKYGIEKFVLELLPVIDNLERSLMVPLEGQHAYQALQEGIILTLKMFYAALEKFGVEKINPQAEAFNPEFHQAVSVQEDASVKPGTILNVFQTGYLLNNRLIRPAMVVVAKTA